MKHIISLTAFTLLLFSQLGAQHLKPIDSIRIAYLKEKLTTASGTEQVDILNDIAWEHSWADKDKATAYDYAKRAKEKASQSKYARGLGYALLTLGWYAQGKNDKLADSVFNEALRIGENINDDRLIARVYYRRWELKKAFEHFKKAGDLQGEADAAAWLCYEYSNSGNYDAEGFSYCQRAVELADVKKESTPGWAWYISVFTFETLSDLYKRVGDYDAALAYLNLAAKYAAPIDYSMDWGYGTFFLHTGKYDSAVYYFERAYRDDPENRFLVKHVGSANLYAKNYTRAVTLLEKAKDILVSSKEKKSFPENWAGDLALELAESYAALENKTLANKYYQLALDRHRIVYNKYMAQRDKGLLNYTHTQTLTETAHGLAKIFHAFQKNDSAYYYLTKYTQLNDSLHNQSTIWRLNMQLSTYKKAAEDAKRTSQLQLLKKDNQLKQSKLRQETLMKNGLALGLIMLALVGVFTVRSLRFKRKAERLRRLQLENELMVRELQSRQKHSELEQKATELEMQALRAQMNPHFIFNCLSSINRFVLKNETEAASDYLTRFSRLIRMVLINSQKQSIPLEDEMEMLRLYLDMERLRFKNSFDYNITYTNTIETGSVFIPPLLLQPFCENAIWHGLMHKEGRGRLDIWITLENKTLLCTITDNGIGTKRAAEIKTKSGEKGKSLGLKITKDRLALLNQNSEIQTFFEMHDLQDENGEAAGTKVVIRIKHSEDIHELA